MRNQIGDVAGRIWELLSEIPDDTINISNIPRKLNVTSTIAYQGLGWLAREGKIEYYQKGRTVAVGLCNCECMI